MQKSIEVEYWVVDEDGELTTPGSLTEISENVEEEFVPPLFELKTPPCETYADLRSTFVDQLDQVLTRADELDKLLVPLGTPVNGEQIERWPSERSRIQKRVLGTNFDYAKYCAGTHLHFEKRNVVDQLNVLAGLDPALALLNSSPYFRGERVANGARAYLYRKKCYENFPKHGQLWEYVDTVAQWERRLDRRLAEFTEAAVEAGIDKMAVEANFTADDVVWTPVRLRDEMPTVEWRAPDATLPSQILRLAEEMDAVMEQLHHANVRVDGTTGEVTDDEIVLPEFETVCDYVADAIYEGLDSADVATYLERMGFDVQGYAPVTRKIDGRERVSPDEAKELRLRYGELLREDVNDLLRN
ncbi:glutamate-cysteine ligase family protein [Halopelagius longus]|uniref:Glutamate--cysteine ligase n=1 Tax=Halopelagius longus TaxID=1236180 RepID=A0A1H1BIS0_9EURY|nr:glutamate-cysteine ligase family protein [Halopelagius longus]RDI70801.1 glutamate--cysteine ligase [Halopelagius longus]SDQ51801.1 Glutamate-cysteine ligase family 2(GCS2) [Halopelagius longus]